MTFTTNRLGRFRAARITFAFAAAIGTAQVLAGPLDTLPAGRWYSFPNSHLENVGPSSGVKGDVGAVINAWGSAVYDTDREQLVVWGGGHSDYSGNEVYAFGPLSSDTPTWKRLTDPSSPAADNSPRGSDGRPVSRHTYNLIDYMPAPYNKMASCAIGSQYSNGYGVGGMDFYDFTVDGFSGQPWSAGPTAPSNTYALEAFCAYNPKTQRLWYQDNNNGSARLQEYNPATNQWTARVNYNPGANVTPAIDTKRNLLVAVGGGKVIVYNLNSPGSAPIIASTSGPTNVQGGTFPGFAYDPVDDRFVGWSGGSQVYSLSIPSNAPSGTWGWSQIPLDSGNSVVPTVVAGLRVQGYETGTFGRFRYVPSRQGVLLVNAADENVFFFKLPSTGGKALPSINLNANPTNVPDQGTTTLTWSTTNAESCTASGAWTGAKATSGSESIGTLRANSTFTLTCDNGAGGTNNRSVTVTVATSTPAPTVTFTATPSSIATGGTSVLAWTTVNATSCTASGAWSGSKGTSGSTSVGPLTKQTSYTLSCTGSGGSTAKTATVSVVSTPPAPIVMVSANPTTIASGANSTISWSVTSATACTASGGWSGSKSATTGSQSVGPLTKNTTFTLSCTGSGGSGQNAATVTISGSTPPPAPAPPAPSPPAAPTVTLTASPQTVDAGDTSTLTWSSTNATSCTASNGWSGAKSTSGTEVTTNLNGATTFTLTCTGSGGTTDPKDVTVNVTPATPPSAAPATSSSRGGGGSLGWLGVLGLLAVFLRRVFAKKALLPLVAVVAASSPVLAADVTNVTIMSQSGSAQTNVPVTFGQAFKPGDVPSGSSVRAKLSSGADLPLQVDAKATNADGSLRHAVLTAVVPSLGGNASQVVTLTTGSALSGTAVSLSNLLATSFNATVSLQVGSTTYTASAREALGASPATWLSGPLASEWIAKMPVKSGSSSHPHLTAYFHVRAYAGNPISQARVDVVIENNWTMVSNPATQNYTATISVPGASPYTVSGLSHYGHTRWHKRMWWGTQPAVYAKLDKDYLQNSRAIPKYENVQPTDSFLNSVRRSTAPMSNGDQTDHMDDTGYQEGIGPLPRWDAVYAVSTDVRAFDYMLANADGGTAYSIHLRDETTGLPVTIDKYPNSSLIDPQGSSPVIPMGGASPHSEGSWSSHQPSIGYTAYLVTGDYFYLEEAQFWSSYNLIWPSISSRGGNAGYWYTGSLRGQAWAYRSLAQSAYITPDAHPLKSYYRTKLLNNIQHDIQAYVTPGGQYKNNLGAMYSYEGNQEYRFFDYFMSWAVQYMVDLGFTEAIPFRDYKVKFPIGLMGIGANDYCYQSAAQYTWKIGPSGSSTFYPDFKTVYQNTASSFASIACDSQAMASAMGVSLHGMSGDQTSTTYYFANLQPALAAAFDSGVSGGQQAWQRSQLSGKHPDYRDNPIWAVIPRGSGQPTIQVTLSANPTSIAPGATTTLSWSSSNADSCTASGGWAGTKATSGTETTAALQANTTFTLTCTSSTLGTATSNALVTVSTPSAPTLNLSASPTTVASGANSTLTWSSTNATACTASGNWTGSKAVSGTQSVGPLTANATYTLSCTGSGGSVQKSASVTISSSTPPPSTPTVTLTASPNTVSSGASSTLTWSSTNATGCTASGGWSGSKGTSGSASSGALSSTTAFALSCTNGTTSAQKSVTITVSSSPPTTPAPTVTVSANPTAVDSGGTSMLTWSSTNATTCTASAGWSGTKPTQGSEATGALTAAATYTLSCSGAGGDTQNSVTVSVNAAPTPPTTPPTSPQQSSSGGGGAMGYFSLLGLLGALGLRYGRRRSLVTTRG